MSTSTDHDRLISAWLEDEAPEHAPERLLTAAREQIRTTTQRRFPWRAWRTPSMNRIVGFGLVAVAVVVAAFIGFQLLGGTGVVGPGPSETPTQDRFSPSSSPAAPDGRLDTGPFALVSPEAFGHQITVTVSAQDWYGVDGGGTLLKNDSAEPPDGAGFIVFYGDLDVYGNPCQWATTRPDPPTGPTVDDMVAALSAQLLRDATLPTDITVDGFAGKAIELTVPGDIDFADCDLGEFRSWQTPTGAPRFHQGPGQIDLLWILDVEGTRVVIDSGSFGTTPAATLVEQQAILESIQID